MAKLIAPEKACCFYEHRNKKNAKYHLIKQNGMYPGELTVCGFIANDDHLPEQEKNLLWKNISDLKSEQLCQKCLGPLKAED